LVDKNINESNNIQILGSNAHAQQVDAAHEIDT